MTTADIVIIIIIIAILVVAVFAWRHRPRPIDTNAAQSGRGIADEMATAVEDVTMGFEDEAGEPRRTDTPADKTIRPHK